jgi:excisionase family DNA binding protein
MEKLAVTIPEAVELSGLGRSTLYKMFREGRLRPRKAGKRTLIVLEDLKRLVESLPVA